MRDRGAFGVTIPVAAIASRSRSMRRDEAAAYGSGSR
jgi:hypothetical protein